jgi:hypothetical protein
VDLRQPGVNGWVGGDQAVKVREPEEPPTPCIIVSTEDTWIPDSPKWRM